MKLRNIKKISLASALITGSILSTAAIGDTVLYNGNPTSGQVQIAANTPYQSFMANGVGVIANGDYIRISLTGASNNTALNSTLSQQVGQYSLMVGFSAHAAGNASGNALTASSSTITQTVQAMMGQTNPTISIQLNGNGNSLATYDITNITITDLGQSLSGSGSSNSITSSIPTFATNSLSGRFAKGAATVLAAEASKSTSQLSGVVTTLGNLTGKAQADAISQTLPSVVGAGSLATLNASQGLNQIVQGRQNAVVGMSSGEDYLVNQNVWMKGFGSWANQNDVNGVTGYKVNTGGLAIGGDMAISPKSTIGAVFAFSNSSVNGNNSAAPSSVTVNSYQLGAYGDYAIDPVLTVNYQADVGFNNNAETRNLSAYAGTTGVTGTNASANYNSWSEHIGTGIRRSYAITPETTFLPELRVDYTSIQSNGYQESGAGVLNLNVSGQTYNQLMLGANLRLDHAITGTTKLTGNVGAGYNALNNQVSVTSSYAGGGTAFATNGLAISPWLYNAGLGLTGKVEKNVELGVRYDVQASTTGYTNQMASAKLKVFF